MSDPKLSAAVVRYVWGDMSEPWPSDRPEALDASQIVFVTRISTMIRAVFDHDPPFYALGGSVSEIGHVVRTFLEGRHPELDSRAREALANLYSFNYR